MNENRSIYSFTTDKRLKKSVNQYESQKCATPRLLTACYKLVTSSLQALPTFPSDVDANPLKEIYLSFNKLKDDSIVNLSACKNLTLLHLASNQIKHVATE